MTEAETEYYCMLKWEHEIFVSDLICHLTFMWNIDIHWVRWRRIYTVINES